MSVMNKRNALLGYVALRMIQRRLKRQPIVARGPKILLVSIVGIASVAAAVGVVAALLRRRGDSDRRELTEDDQSATAEPIPAT